MKAVQQSGLLKIAPTIVAAEDVIAEFLDYEIKVDANANDKYGAFKVGSHDDLVTALGLAVLKTPSGKQPLVSRVGPRTNEALVHRLGQSIINSEQQSPT